MTTTKENEEIPEQAEDEIEKLAERIKELEIKIQETEQVVIVLSNSIKELAGIQQQIANQLVVVSDSIQAIQDAIDPSATLKYDMLNEPYN